MSKNDNNKIKKKIKARITYLLIVPTSLFSKVIHNIPRYLI